MAAEQTMTLDSLNSVDESGFMAAMGGIVENAPWLTLRAFRHAPFASVDALVDAFAAVIHGATLDEKLVLLRGHPELAGREAVEGEMTAESTGEQGRLGLLSLSSATHARILAHNAAYHQAFGFPFIIALRRHDSLDTVLADMELRLGHSREQEISRALDEIVEVVRGRVAIKLKEDVTLPPGSGQRPGFPMHSPVQTS